MKHKFVNVTELMLLSYTSGTGKLDQYCD